MEQRTCIFEDCIEPATRSITLTWPPVTRVFDICGDHFHEIDWGVISQDDVTAEARATGLLNRLALVESRREENGGIRLQDDPSQSATDLSA